MTKKKKKKPSVKASDMAKILVNNQITVVLQTPSSSHDWSPRP